MAATVSSLVHETTTTTGTGTLTLTNASGKRSFNTAFGTGGTDAFYYFISHQSAAEYEWGTGHLSASTTLVRDTIIGSSNANAAVSFAAGTKDVTCDIPAVNQGINPITQGKHTIWIPAAAMTPQTTNGAALGTLEMTTNKNMVKTLDFDSSTQEGAQFEIAMPKSWNEGTLTFQPIWSHPSTSTNFGVSWALQAVAQSDGDALDVAYGTAQGSVDTGGTTNTRYIGPETSAITVGGSPTAGDVVQFRLQRIPADGADTLAVDARLHGVKLYYTIDAATDA